MLSGFLSGSGSVGLGASLMFRPHTSQGEAPSRWNIPPEFQLSPVGTQPAFTPRPHSLPVSLCWRGLLSVLAYKAFLIQLFRMITPQLSCNSRLVLGEGECSFYFPLPSWISFPWVLKVHFMSPCFYERLTLIPGFSNQKKSQDDFHFYEKKVKKHSAFVCSEPI